MTVEMRCARRRGAPPLKVCNPRALPRVTNLLEAVGRGRQSSAEPAQRSLDCRTRQRTKDPPQARRMGSPFFRSTTNFRSHGWPCSKRVCHALLVSDSMSESIQYSGASFSLGIVPRVNPLPPSDANRKQKKLKKKIIKKSFQLKIVTF